MHSVARSSLVRLALWRGLVCALLAPALVLTALDLHSSDLPHGAFDGPGVVLADARHPLAPEHFESSVAIQVPPCLACLLHSKTSCAAVAPLELQPQPIVADAVSAPIAPAEPFSLAYGLGSRGPPLA